jgi:two-component system phosphate regulon response regulator OmpR
MSPQGEVVTVNVGAPRPSLFVTGWIMRARANRLFSTHCKGDKGLSEIKADRVIVVDDDPELRALLQRYLNENGFVVRTAADGTGLDRALQRSPADVIVLDLMMPGEDGLAICRRLRAGGDDTPILMLTARGDPVDRILGLEMGADDYLAKPFTPRELLARLSAILRRTGARAKVNESLINFGPFTLDLAAMTLARDGAPVELSSREFSLLRALATHPGKPLTRAHLIELALGRDAEVTDRAIDVQVARLRRVIETDPAAPVWVKTVWGVGYVFAKEGTAK